MRGDGEPLNANTLDVCKAHRDGCYSHPTVYRISDFALKQEPGSKHTVRAGGGLYCYVCTYRDLGFGARLASTWETQSTHPPIFQRLHIQEEESQ
jgi:hypothetical protein